MKSTIKFFLLLSILSVLVGQRVVGYYPQWVQTGYPMSDIDLSIVSHVNHAFAWPDEQGSIHSYDGMFSVSNSQVIHDGGGKLLLSIGGGGNELGFSSIAASNILRSIFIQNLLSICDIYGYDGIDINWEHPISEDDRENLNLLISEIDSSFEIYNDELLITMAIPISNWFGQWYDFLFLTEYVDFFNVMTYNIHGSWSEDAGHNSPLFQSPPGDPDGSCVTAINYLTITREIPSSKLNLGLPFWGKKYIATDINEPFEGEVDDIWYYEIQDMIGNGWDYQWDSNAFCPYLIRSNQLEIITYDDEESIGYKCQYANSEDLGGVMIWALGYDSFNDTQELLESIGSNYLNLSKDYSMMPSQILLKTYPNPFNHSSIIEYEVYNNDFFNMDLYSIKGQYIDRLFSGKRNIGKHRFFWKVDEMRFKISSGVFLLIMSSKNSKSVKKVVYLK